MRRIKVNVDVETIDIPTMNELSDAEYRGFVEKFGLVFVDHHDVLRSAVADYPLATTLEQFDIFMDVMRKKFRQKMVSKDA